MKIVKISVSIVLVLLIVAAILFGFVFSQLNSLVETVIERAGTTITQTAVRVDAVDIALREGKGEITGLSIANPQGFSRSDLLQVGDVGLQLDVASLLTPVKVVEQVYINGVQLRAEQKKVTQTNIQALIENLSASLPATNAKSSAATAEKSEEDAIRLMIKQLAVGESRLLLETEKWGSRTLTLPAYQQADIGDPNTGLSPEQLGNVIVDTLLKRAKNALEVELRTLAKSEVDARLQEEKAKLQGKIDEKLSTEEEKLKQAVEKNLSKENAEKLKALFNK